MPDNIQDPTQPIQPQTSPLASEPADTEPDSMPVLRLRMAFDAVLPEMKALEPDELLRINVDVAVACVTILGCIPKIQPYREKLLKLEDFDPNAIEKLETYALAAQHSQTRYQSATAPPAALPELLEQMTTIREHLLYDLTGAANHGYVDGSPLRNLKGPLTRVDVGQHTLVLVNLARENFATLSGKIPYTMQDLKRIEADADHLLNLIGVNVQGAPVVEVVADERVRAFTLLHGAYDQVRRGLTFLRWKQQDVESIAPSLYAGRGGRGRRSEPDAPAIQPGPAQPGPTPTPVAGPQPGPAPVPPIGSNGVPLPTGPGMPGNEPFGP